MAQVKTEAVTEPTQASEITGIHQSDLTIRSAIIEGIKELRACPWLLRYAFWGLAQDELTKSVYGTGQIDKATRWFQRNRIQVVLDVAPTTARFPAISISLQNSNEQNVTLADIHYQPQELAAAEWPVLAGPLTPTSYDPDTGEMVVADSDLGGVVLAPGMSVVTRTGASYTITEETDTGFLIDTDLTDDFGDMVIKTIAEPNQVQIESAVFNETYAIGAHVDSEPVHLIYLHSILVFILLRYRQSLLEARGFEGSNITSANMRRDDFTLPEAIYSRYVQVQGRVRQTWPKAISKRPVAMRARARAKDQYGNWAPAEEDDDPDLFALAEADPSTLLLSKP